MTGWSLLPVWITDLLGALGMILFSSLCLGRSLRMAGRDPENPLATYLLWFCGAIFAFSISRSAGHIVRHVLFFTGHGEQWQRLAPISGSINSITFVVISAVTLFFHRMERIIQRMARDRQRIESTSQELLRLNRDMEAIVADRTRSELALQIAHEVRNPAMIIGGLTRRLVKSEQTPTARDDMERILAAARQLEKLVAEFESVQPQHKVTFMAQELSAIVEEAVALVQSEADDKGIIILLDLAAARLTFQGNEELIKMAVLHILRNAIEACGSGDTVQVTTGLQDKGVVLRIEDSGPGIPEEVRRHLFKPIPHAAHGKTAFGLAYVRQIVDEHLGEITVESEEGRGTTVEIVLPTHLGELTGRKSSSAPPAPEYVI